MKLIVGLGNPGREYENTRHNIGFMILDNYLKDASWQEKFNSLYTTLNIQNEKVFFLKPLTYMNLSGQAIAKFTNYFKIPLEDILIIHDDLDLNIGTYRLKINSGDGGHNGIKSIIEHLGTNTFGRLKIGISNSQNIPTKDYVLGQFTLAEMEIITNLYPKLNEIMRSFITEDFTKLMSEYNGKQ